MRTSKPRAGSDSLETLVGYGTVVLQLVRAEMSDDDLEVCVVGPAGFAAPDEEIRLIKVVESLPPDGDS